MVSRLACPINCRIGRAIGITNPHQHRRPPPDQAPLPFDEFFQSLDQDGDPLAGQTHQAAPHLAGQTHQAAPHLAGQTHQQGTSYIPHSNEENGGTHQGLVGQTHQGLVGQTHHLVNQDDQEGRKKEEKERGREETPPLIHIILILILYPSTSVQSVLDVVSKARRMQRVVGHPGLVVVDYLQRLGSWGERGRTDTRSNEIEQSAYVLKELAGSMETPILALAQLNRGSEHRRAPVLSDLRDSGGIEQAADQVLLLHRREEPAEGVVDVHIAKNRDGETGVVPLFFDAKTTTFRSLARGGWRH